MAVEAFSYNFGHFQENVDLIDWLRSHNQHAPPDGRVRFYGVDLAGQGFPFAHRSLEAVLAYLKKADAELAARVRPMLDPVIPIFNSDTFPGLAAAQRDHIAVVIDDLIALLDQERADLVQATSLDDYEWARRQAVGAWQDNAFLRVRPPGPQRREKSRWRTIGSISGGPLLALRSAG
jgi:erythromycin esterase-like protein